MMQSVNGSLIDSLPLIKSGKVRELYAVSDEHLLIVTTDKISAFDVVLPDLIPGKGCILTTVSNFWFDYCGDIMANHLTDIPFQDYVQEQSLYPRLEGRTVVVRNIEPLPIEAVVRGYLSGSAWQSYQQSGSICGIRLPQGLLPAAQLPEPIFTPATKAAIGEHDENIDFAKMTDLIGQERAEKVRTMSLKIYTQAADYALAKGIIIADTKFEFGVDASGELVLIDELLTPDSSRFWSAADYQCGQVPASFDKQYVRDYLITVNWNKTAPGPKLPIAVISNTVAKYTSIRDKIILQ